MFAGVRDCFSYLVKVFEDRYTTCLAGCEGYVEPISELEQWQQTVGHCREIARPLNEKRVDLGNAERVTSGQASSPAA